MWSSAATAEAPTLEEARDIQRREMRGGLGPAKGKDFATTIGPWLVTPEELEPARVGDRLDLTIW